MRLIKTEDAVGHVLCHDMTQIIKDQYKDARFRKGHVVTEEDIPVLLSMGKEHLYVWEMTSGMVHENDAAERLAALCGRENMTWSETKEGKIELKSAIEGVFLVDSARLFAVNSIDELMIATRRGGGTVHPGDKLAGTRVIPLIIREEKLRQAEQAAGSAPLLSVRPFVRRTAAVITTGSEVAKGRIPDSFTPVVERKLAAFGIRMTEHILVEDGQENVLTAIEQMKRRPVDMILCTGGMSVDPDDSTPGAIKASGADMALVCLGAPKQELWMQRNAPRLRVGLMAGLGGSLDVFAGNVKRAPKFFQKLGLEWFYRLIKEPKRIGRMMKLPLFLVHVSGEKRK